jgi:T-complex protein 1 subunit beta
LQLASIMQTTLGPFGMDKLLVDEQGGVMTTNDGAKLVTYLHLDHPAALLMAQVSKSQDDVVGDGTTSVILLTAELLKQAQILISSRGIHPSHIIHVFRKAQKYASDIIQQQAINLDDENKIKYLEMIAKTSIGSKIISTNEKHFCDIAIKAALQLNGNRGNVYMFKRTGASMMQSKILNGVMLSCRRLGVSSPTRIENAKILVCRMDSLASARSKIYNTNIKMNDNEDIDVLSRIEIEHLENVCETIVKLGVNVVFNCGIAIHQHAEQYFNSKNIMCMGFIDFTDSNMLSKVTGAHIITRIDDNSVYSRLGHADLVQHVIMANEPALIISGCQITDSWCSILLRAPTKSMLSECEFGLHDALCVLGEAIRCGKIIGGGGSLYMEIAQKMREGSRKCSGVQQLIIEAFTSALESIPITLARNGGYNASKILAQLRTLHSQEGNIWLGVDMNRGSVCNMLESGVVEPISIMMNVLKSAMDATEMILRIDQNVFLKPGKSLQELGIV